MIHAFGGAGEDVVDADEDFDAWGDLLGKHGA